MKKENEKQLDYKDFVDDFILRASVNNQRMTLVFGELKVEELLRDSAELNASLKMLHGGIDPYVIISDLCAVIQKRNKFISEKFESGQWTENRFPKLK